MKNNVKHVLGISGGKDSAALAIYLHDKYPTLDINYYFCDTGKELDETYLLIDNIEAYLGKKITKIKAVKDSHEESPFDHFLKLYGGYLPSSKARWCTKKLKLEPFEEQIVKEDLTISYVGIREDEDREGYISTKPNIQSIFPFRKNIWSMDLTQVILNNSVIPLMSELADQFITKVKLDKFQDIIKKEVAPSYPLKRKLNDFLILGIKEYNKIVFEFAKILNIPISSMHEFPLVDNEDGLVRSDIFNILESSGVGIPGYYTKIKFESDGKEGYYSRSRSGCFFCFFQQKIEWVWLYENHPKRFWQAVDYEKDGYTWMQDEKLVDLIKPERLKKIKDDYIKKTKKCTDNHKSEFLIDIIQDAEGDTACFI